MQQTTTTTEANEDESSVRVIVRARPLGASEKLEGCRSCITYHEGGRQLTLGKDKSFTFDAIYPPDTEQMTIYNEWVAALVDSCFLGYNATVLAYGQTGAGKTYTMGTAHSVNTLEETTGVIPRVFRQIFKIIEDRKLGNDCAVRASFIEIYNEEIKDLLHTSTPSKNLAIREKSDGTIVMSGVQDEVVGSFEELTMMLDNGSITRTVGSTHMNQHSSRSHAIFTIVIEQATGSSDGYISAKLHLVDLAGSERAKRTGNVGVRLKESVSINTGLLALGNVISCLGDVKKRGHHVPYRDSKLTRMLQDSLGGNSKTLMIACVSPADVNFEETLNTIKYANRARNIRNKPVVNRMRESTLLLEDMQTEIQRLQQELRKSNPIRDIPENLDEATLAEYEQQIMELNEKMDTEKQRSRRMEQQLMGLDTERDKLRDVLEDGRQRLLRIADFLATTAECGDIDKMRINLQQLEQFVSDTVRKFAGESIRPKTAPSMNQSHLDQSDMSVRHTLDFDDDKKPKSRIEEQNSAIIERNLLKIRRLQDELFSAKQMIELQEKEISSLKADLQRDEVIFAEKKREMKALAQHNKNIQEKLEQLQAIAMQPQTRPASTGDIVRPRRRWNEENSVLETTMHGSNRAFGELVEDADEVQLDHDNDNFDTPKHALQESKEDLEKSIVQLEEENSRILNEKKSIEEQKRILEQQTNALNRKYQEEQQHAERQLRDLEFGMNLKEGLIKSLIQSEQELQRANEEAAQRVSKLEKDLEATRSLPPEVAKEKESELAQLKQQQKDYVKILAQKRQSDKKIRDLEAEVTRMKCEHDMLQQKVRGDKDKFSTEEKKTSQKLLEFQKITEKRIRELEQENAKQRELLAKKSIQLNKVQQNSGNNSKMSIDDLDTRRKWLDLEIEKHLKKVESTEQLQRELNRRQQIIQEKEEILQQKEGLLLRRERGMTAVRESIRTLDTQIGSLNKDLQQKEAQLQEKKQGVDIMHLSTQVEALVEQRETALKQRERFESKMKTKNVLTKEEEMELQEIEDRLDTLEAEIEYKDAEISNLQSSVADLSRGDIAGVNLDQLSLVESKMLIEQYAKKMDALAELNRRYVMNVQKLQLEIDQATQQLQEKDNILRKLEIDRDRQLTNQQKDYEVKIGYLLKQINSGSKGQSAPSSSQDIISTLEKKRSLLEEQNGILEKDNYYYKHTNKELKRQLRQLVATSEHEREISEKSQEENRQLHAQIDNLKGFVQSRGLASSVRVSSKDLRQISEQKIEEMRASSSSTDLNPPPRAPSVGGFRPRPNTGPELDQDRNILYGMDVDAGDSVILE